MYDRLVDENRGGYMREISEPVATLIKLFNENPRRFKIVFEERGSKVSITDTVTGCVFSAKIGKSSRWIPLSGGEDWMTGHEFCSCEYHIRCYLEKRRKRKQMLLDERRIKRESARRESLRGYYMNVYCGEEKHT